MAPTQTAPVSTNPQELRKALRSFKTGLQRAGGGTWTTPPLSPTSSSSTLAVDDSDEAKDVLDIQKLNLGGIHPGVTPLNPALSDYVELDPQAPPFVPLLPPAPAATTTPARCLLLRPYRDPTMLQPQITKWLRTLRRGILPPFDTPQKVLALILIGADKWQSETMAELAQEICWIATEGSPEELEGALTMTALILFQFYEMKGQQLAHSFLWHVNETAVGTFLSTWDANHCREAISYQWKPSEQHLNAATRLGIFIAQLYKRNIMPNQYLEVCFETLISNFVSMEHADVVQAMFLHTGPTYWFGHPQGPMHVASFGRAVATVAQKLRGEMSVMGRKRNDREVEALLEGICERCRQWNDAMVQVMEQKRQQQQQRQQTPRPY